MAKRPIPTDPKQEETLLSIFLDPSLSPLEFVIMAYPWGKPGTLLEGIPGPRNWQRAFLEDLGDYIKSANKQWYTSGKTVLPDFYRHAVASGRGIGKSALVGWLTHWMLSTRLGSSVWIAANGESQLRTRTFPEVSTWFSSSINAHWWEMEAMSIRPAPWFNDLVAKARGVDTRYYSATAQLWSISNPSAFAGAHNPAGEMALFDEASGIPSEFWDIQQGVFTENTVDKYWVAISNPREPTGAFFECFNKHRDTWRTTQVDARTVDGIPPRTYELIIQQHGPDSIQAKVEVYGQFPEQGENQFISRQVVRDSIERPVQEDPGAPLLIGVDPARFGDDSTVIAFRRGRDAKSIPWVKARGWSTTQTVGKVAELANQYNPDAIFVDGGGVGGGVVDQLKGLGFRVIEVQSGESAKNKEKYANKRVEMWDRMRDWLPLGTLPDLKGIEDDLCNLLYNYTPANAIKLERKDELKKRGYASPDMADALALTFAESVARTDLKAHRTSRRVAVARNVEYNVLS